MEKPPLLPLRVFGRYVLASPDHAVWPRRVSRAGMFGAPRACNERAVGYREVQRVVQQQRTSADRPRAATVALLGTAVVLGYGGLASLQIALLNPLEAAPGRDLSQIHMDLDRAGESMGPWWAIMVVWAAVAIAHLVRNLGRVTQPPGKVAVKYLTLLVLGVPVYWLASFSPGAALADTYDISGGDAAPWGIPLYVTSALALSLLLVLTCWTPTSRSRRRDS